MGRLVFQGIIAVMQFPLLISRGKFCEYYVNLLLLLLYAHPSSQSKEYKYQAMHL